MSKTVDFTIPGGAGSVRWGGESIQSAHYMGEQLWPFDPDPLRGDGFNGFFLADRGLLGPDGVNLAQPNERVTAFPECFDGLELGPELIPEGEGDGTSLNGWVTSGASPLLTLSGGSFRLTNGAASEALAGRAIACEIGDIFYFQFNRGAINIGSGSVRPAGGVSYATGGVTNPIQAGLNGVFIQATSTTCTPRMGTNAGTLGSWVEFDNVSIRKVLTPLLTTHTVTGAHGLRGRAPKVVRNLLSSSAIASLLDAIVTQNVSEDEQGLMTMTRVERTSTGLANRGQGLITGTTMAVVVGERYTFSGLVRKYGWGAKIQATFCGIGIGIREDGTFDIALYGVAFAGATDFQYGAIDEGNGLIRLWITVVAVGSQSGSTIWVHGGLGWDQPIGAYADYGKVQFEKGYLSDIQTVGPAGQRDLTEVGVRSFGLYSMDGIDDTVRARLVTGQTVALAVFGRGGSYLLPSITLGGPSVLIVGPVSILDDGALIPECTPSILRAIGFVPWSVRLEIVGVAIMKPNPSEAEKAKVMRFFRDYGAQGWLVEGPNIMPNGSFDTDIAGWGLSAGLTAQWVDGEVELTGLGINNFPSIFRTVTGLDPTLSYVTKGRSRRGTTAGGMLIQVTPPGNPNGRIDFTQTFNEDKALVISPAATSVGVNLYLNMSLATGTGYFDNIELRALIPSPIL